MIGAVHCFSLCPQYGEHSFRMLVLLLFIAYVVKLAPISPS